MTWNISDLLGISVRTNNSEGIFLMRDKDGVQHDRPSHQPSLLLR